MTLFLIKDQVNFFTSIEDFSQVLHAEIKRSSIDREIIHKNLYFTVIIVKENGNHAPLTSDQGII